MTVFDAALGYAALGRLVFPVWGWNDDGTCRCGQLDGNEPCRGGKHPVGPLVPRGCKDATTDEHKIREWWGNGQEYGVAVATGYGFWVLDEDEPNAADAFKPPRTLTARTPSGGRHFYFLGDGMRNTAKRVPGCDTRGEGGYVVVPPTPGYEWIDECDIVQPPEELMRVLAKPRPRTGGKPAAYAERALANEIAKVHGASQGERNDTLNRAAFNLGQLSPPLEAEPTLQALIGAALAAGLSEPETVRTAQGAFSAGQESPRASRAASDTEIAPPSPLPGDAPPPPFPSHVLSAWMQQWVNQAATATQTPRDLAGLLVLSVVATTCAKKVRVRVKPGWEEPTNMYALVVLPPGERKSAVFKMATEPLFRFEKDLRARVGPDRTSALQRVDVLADALKKLKREAAKAKGAKREELLRGVEEAAAELAKAEQSVPAVPRLFADDVTPERLVGLMAEQGGRMAVLSAEGDLFEIVAGRYTEGRPNLVAFLKAHAGDAILVDRVGRTPEAVACPALTLGLTIQPDVLRGLTKKRGFRGQGLLARFAYAIPDSPVGSREVDPPPIREGVQRAYERAVALLLELPEVVDADGEIEPTTLVLSDSARALLLSYLGELEPRLGPDGDLTAIRDWAGKLVGLVARLAALLATGDRAPTGQGGIGRYVDDAHVHRAVELGDYLLAHAIRAFNTMQRDPATDDARAVLRWLKKDGRRVVSKRDVFNGLRRRFHRVQDLDPVLDLLEEHGYLRAMDAPRRSGPGRPASPKYEVNPHWPVRTNRTKGV